MISGEVPLLLLLRLLLLSLLLVLILVLALVPVLQQILVGLQVGERTRPVQQPRSRLVERQCREPTCPPASLTPESRLLPAARQDAAGRARRGSGCARAKGLTGLGSRG